MRTRPAGLPGPGTRRVASRCDPGFTVVELLVVMLVLGLLAAIAIPSFFNQRDKARDAYAKEAVRTAQTAIETFATGNDDRYSTATVTDLQEIEATLTDVGPRLTLPVPAGGRSYTIQVESTGSDHNIFQITRAADASQSLRCGATAGVPPADPGRGGCPASGVWGG